MKKKKYYYDTSTNTFERLITPLRKKLLRGVGFLSATLVTALIIVAVAYRVIPSPGEKESQQEMAKMTEEYDALQKQYKTLSRELAALENRDDNIYRAIFESEPIPDSLREGRNYADSTVKKYAYTATETLINTTRQQALSLKKRIATQNKSYDTLQQMVRAKEAMLACIPAVQPVSNDDLNRIASGYGYRIDPVYKTPKLHTGLDFAAPQGTPIYATADGRVASTAYDESGYGNHVIVNHGYGYETLYGHMVRVKVRPGETVKRGQLIGWVGSTGKSTGPHCHYEVIRNGNKIDPIHYFFNDLSAQDYERMVKIAATSNQSFD